MHEKTPSLREFLEPTAKIHLTACINLDAQERIKSPARKPPVVLIGKHQKSGTDTHLEEMLAELLDEVGGKYHHCWSFRKPTSERNLGDPEFESLVVSTSSE